jgi:predicted metal-binding membrane protein
MRWFASGGTERLITAGALALLAALGWVELLVVPMPMPDARGPVTLDYAALTALMWLAMMVAMMTPSVAPVVMLYASVVRRAAPDALLRVGLFVGGYFASWAGFSLAVALLQIALIERGWIDAMGVARGPLFAAALLFAVAAYQWTPGKRSCLAHCRSPLEFLVQHHRAGRRGAWQMGAAHGLYCVGCCWLLMLLLFVGGVMNLAWVAGLALIVALEKLFARADLVRRVTGVLAAAAGLACLAFWR